MSMDAVDDKIKGAEMPFVEIEPGPGKAGGGDAGSLFFMDPVITMDTVFGGGRRHPSGGIISGASE